MLPVKIRKELKLLENGIIPNKPFFLGAVYNGVLVSIDYYSYCNILYLGTEEIVFRHLGYEVFILSSVLLYQNRWIDYSEIPEIIWGESRILANGEEFITYGEWNNTDYIRYYKASLRINKRIVAKSGIDDFLIFDTKKVRLNCKYKFL